MSKKGRTSVVLLSSLVLCLLFIPLVYLAYGARVDRTVLNRRIALLEATEVTGPAALQDRYRVSRERILPILPPDPGYPFNSHGGIVVFNPANFSWAAELEPAELNGVTVYPVTVAEDPETRHTVFYNGSAEAVGYIAPEQDYFPFAWLEERHAEYYAENADPAVRAWAEAVYDPARISITYYLLALDDVEAMATAMMATAQPNLQMNMMMGEGLSEPVTNIVIFAIEKATNGMALGIGWPNDFTNNLEVFARNAIGPTGWSVVSPTLSTAGTNSLWWIDTSTQSNGNVIFYRVGNADLDTDGDGLTDAREMRIWGADREYTDTDGDGIWDGDEVNIYHTDPVNYDTDGDGLDDGYENEYGTDPLNRDTDGDGVTDGNEWEIGSDPLDTDTDGDGLFDNEEVNGLYGYYTDPTNADSDNDWIDDDDELFLYGTNPVNRDTDEDGLYDGEELYHVFGFTDLLNPDSDDDDLNDGDEVFLYFTDPVNRDTDEDGLYDGEEILSYETNPFEVDTDGDSLKDGEEVKTYGTAPLEVDTDNDGLRDGEEVFGYTAWAVTSTTSTNMGWSYPGSNAQWISQWTIGEVSNGIIRGGLSDYLNVPIQIGDATHETVRISSDGLILLGSNNSNEALTYGVNLPLTWPTISNLLAVCWDEYSISATTGVWYEVTGSGLTERVTVTWTAAKISNFDQLMEGLDFQMIYTASNRSFTYRYKTSPGLQFPEKSLYTVGSKGPTTNRLCRIVFNRLNMVEPGTTITIMPGSTCPTNSDTDADGFLDGYESGRGWDPTTFFDWLSDVDGDGLDDFNEAYGSYGYQTDPFDVDSDGDGLDDKYEIDIGINPINPYDYIWDGDYLSLEEEYCYGTNPWLADTDSDQVDDYTEITQGSNPCDMFDGGLAPEASYEFRPRLYTESPMGLGGTIFKVGNYRLTPTMFWDNGYASLKLSKGCDFDLDVFTQEGFVQCPQVNTSIESSEGEFVPVIGEDSFVCNELMIQNASLVFGALGVVSCQEQEEEQMMLKGYNITTPASPKAKIISRTIEIIDIDRAYVPGDVCPGTLVRLKATVTPECQGSFSWSSNPNVSITTSSGRWANQNAQFTVNTNLVITCRFIDSTWKTNDFHNTVSIDRHNHYAFFTQSSSQNYGYDTNDNWVSIETSKTTTIRANVSPEDCSGPFYISSTDSSKVSVSPSQVSHSQDITLSAGPEESSDVDIVLRSSSSTGPVISTVHVAIYKKRIINVFIHKTNGAILTPSISNANSILKQALVEINLDSSHSCTNHTYPGGGNLNLQVDQSHNEDEDLVNNCPYFASTNLDNQPIYILVAPTIILRNDGTGVKNLRGLHTGHPTLGHFNTLVEEQDNNGCLLAHEIFHTFTPIVNDGHDESSGNLMNEANESNVLLKHEQWQMAH